MVEYHQGLVYRPLLISPCSINFLWPIAGTRGRWYIARKDQQLFQFACSVFAHT